MATLKIISNRLKSVKNIQKITKSMKMVSAAKYSRAERELREARPYGEGSNSFFEKLDVKTEEPRDSDKFIIAVSSDKGLCGAVHSQVAKAIKAELKDTPGNTKILCIGDKSRILLQGLYKQNIVAVATEVGRLPPNFKDASKIALQAKEHDFNIAKIVFNKFKTVVSYGVSEVTIFSETDILGSPKSLVYDSLESDVLESYLEYSFASLIFYTMKENACSEQASRMSAMDNASKNAGDMIDMLTLKFNRTRQAVITRELIEIISGASALK